MLVPLCFFFFSLGVFCGESASQGRRSFENVAGLRRNWRYVIRCVSFFAFYFAGEKSARAFFVDDGDRRQTDRDRNRYSENSGSEVFYVRLID